MVKENKLWKFVFSFINEEFNCFNTIEKGINRGLLTVGLADVIGIRDMGGWQGGDIEVITVEVKTNTSSFGKKLGEAFGYSVYSHRCYLACLLERNEKFTNFQKDMAAKIGVGLIEIRKGRRGDYKCKEITTAPYNQPINYILRNFCERAGFVKCSICDSWIKSDNFSYKLQDEKGFQWLRRFNKKQDRDEEMFWSRDKKLVKRFYICKNCKNNKLFKK